MAESVTLRILRRIGEEAVIRIKSKVTSQTLRESFKVRKLPGKETIAVSTPYYWARYYFEGRGPVYPREKTWLVWFQNPRDDPRNAGGYPKQKGDRRRLTAEEFAWGLEMNRLLGTEEESMPFMVIAQRSGPFPGTGELRKALRDFPRVARRIVKREFDQEMGRLLREIDFPRQRGKGDSGARVTFTLG